RINCVLGGLFLLCTYLAMPAFPWLPAPPQNEGNYVFINKNVIEMLALFVLATMKTGRWFGADGVLAWLWTGVTGARLDDDGEDSPPHPPRRGRGKTAQRRKLGHRHDAGTARRGRAELQGHRGPGGAEPPRFPQDRHPGGRGRRRHGGGAVLRLPERPRQPG